MTAATSVYLHADSPEELVCFASVQDVARGLAEGQYSARELTEVFLRRIERLNSDLGAYVAVLRDEALRTADESDRRRRAGQSLGLFDGIPVSVKDFAPVKGAPFTAGLRPLKGHIADVDATYVRRFREAGAVILGLTNTSEMGHKGITDNMLFGPTRNPHHLDYNAGGSSGGAAASVAAGLAVVAQGTDGGGSVRIPAAMCGIVGGIGTAGAWAEETRPDAFAAASPFVRIGALGRSAADVRAVADLLGRYSPRDPLSAPAVADVPTARATRLFFDPHFGDFPVNAEVLDLTHAAVEALAGRYQVRPGTVCLPSYHDTNRIFVRQASVLMAFVSEQFSNGGVDLLGAHRGEIPDELADIIEMGRGVSALQQRRDNVVRTEVFDTIEDALEEADVIVTPCLAVAEVRNEASGRTLGPRMVAGQAIEPTIGWCLTYPINLSGHPSVSVPIGYTRRGLPVGLQIIGARWADRAVLELAEKVIETLAVPRTGDHLHP